MVRALAAVAATFIASHGAGQRRLAVVDVDTPPQMLGLGQQVTQAVLSAARAQGYAILSPEDILATLGPKPYGELIKCSGEPTCVSHKLGPLGADRAVVGTLGRDERSYLVKLWLVDLKKAEVISDVDRAILIASRRLMADVNLAVPDLLKGNREARGVLKLQANAKNVSVFLDDALIGTTPLEKELKPGRYQLRAEKKAYLTTSRWVTVAPNAVTNENLRLIVQPGQTPEEEALPTLSAQPQTPRSGELSVPPLAWAALGAGALAGGVGVGFGVAAQRLQRTLTAGYNPATQIDSGTRAQALAGKQDALLANVLYGVAGAGLAAAVVLTVLHTSSAISLAPAPGGAALAVSGSF